MYRFLRCFLCLLVVCCLILNLSPIKADAMSGGLLAPLVSGAAVTVSAPVAIGACLIALGIMAGTNDDFRRVVGNAVDSLGDWVKDGTVELIQTVDTLGKKSYYIASDFLEDVRSFVFTSGAVSQSALAYSHTVSVTNNSFWSYNGTLSSSRPFQVVMIWRTGYSYYAAYEVFAYCDYDGNYLEIDVNGNKKYGTRVGNYYVCNLMLGTSGDACSRFEPTGNIRVIHDTRAYTSWDPLIADLFGNGISSSYTSNDLVLGYVPSVPVDGTSAREWSEEYTNRGLYVDPVGDGDGNDEDGKWYWPLVLAPGIESLTQTDQWTGTTTDVFDDYETEEEYEVVGTPVVPFGSGVQLKPVTVPGTGDDTEVDSGTIDGTADYTSWFDKIVGFLQNIWDSIKELPSKFATWFEAIIEGIAALPGKFATWFETIIEGIQAIPDVLSGWFTDVLEWLTSIWEAICSIPDLILDGIRAIFVPSEDFVTTKVEALRDRFSWIEPILGYGNYIKAQLVNPEPPVLYVHLGNAEGSYNYGGTVKFLDLTWYERYKSQGDAIISGFLWALFAWRMYVKLPGIINGVAGDVGHISYGESAWQKADGRKERKEKGGKNK